MKKVQEMVASFVRVSEDGKSGGGRGSLAEDTEDGMAELDGAVGEAMAIAKQAVEAAVGILENMGMGDVAQIISGIWPQVEGILGGIISSFSGLFGR